MVFHILKVLSQVKQIKNIFTNFICPVITSAQNKIDRLFSEFVRQIANCRPL